MANTIKIKQSATALNVPTAGQLVQGELAINVADKKLYSKDATTVFEIGGPTAAADIGTGNLPSDVVPYVSGSGAGSEFKVLFANTTGVSSGNFGLLIDNNSDNLTYNPFTNNLKASLFTGSGAGLTSVPATSITSGALANSVDLYTKISTAASPFKVPFLTTIANTAGNYAQAMTDTTLNFAYNPSTNTLYAGTFSGNATSATTATTAAAWATGRTITLTGDTTGVSGSWTGSGNISFATTIDAKFLRHVTSGYTSGDIDVTGTEPVSPAQGDIWFDTSATASVAWGDITSTPTTLSAYGITDALSSSGESFIQSTGQSTSWGNSNGVSTGAFNAIMGTASSATWLVSGTSGGVFRGGLQVLDGGSTCRLYASANYMQMNNSGISFNGGSILTSNAGTVTSVGGTGSVNGITLSGTVTSSGNLTLGGSITSVAASAISSGSLGSGVYPYITATTGASDYKIAFVNSTGSTSGNANLLKSGTTSEFTFNPSTRVFTAGYVTVTLSDERLKENIVDYVPPSFAFKARQYDFKGGAKDRVGYIAQEVAKELPEAVHGGKDGGMLTLDYAMIFVAKIAQLEARIEELEGR